VGFLKDKNYQLMVKLIAEYADKVFVTTPNSKRALNGEKLAAEFRKNAIDAININGNYNQVLSAAKNNDLICVTGSFYVVGDFIKFL
jgi:dihydrofolate synthase/folylpolyglutamate synthase